MTTSRVAAVLFAALAISTCAVHDACADDYPSRPIRLVVPATPGGLLDILARLLSERLDSALGQPVVVENRPAAAGNLGVELVAKAAPAVTHFALFRSVTSPPIRIYTRIFPLTPCAISRRSPPSPARRKLSSPIRACLPTIFRS